MAARALLAGAALAVLVGHTTTTNICAGSLTDDPLWDCASVAGLCATNQVRAFICSCMCHAHICASPLSTGSVNPIAAPHIAATCMRSVSFDPSKNDGSVDDDTTHVVCTLSSVLINAVRERPSGVGGPN